MRAALRAKFEQNIMLKLALIATGNSILVETSPHDVFWGAGLSINDARLADYTRWPGQNVLGRLLQELRYELYKN